MNKFLRFLRFYTYIHTKILFVKYILLIIPYSIAFYINWIYNNTSYYYFSNSEDTYFQVNYSLNIF